MPLRIHLWAGPLVNSEAEVVVGDRAITVRPHACSRGACLEKLLNNELGGLHQAAVGAWIIQVFLFGIHPSKWVTHGDT